MTDTPEWVTRTQAELGAVISHPKMAEKLLMKPPVRFLHDVVTSFIKTAAFPLNYYSEDMLDSSKLQEKEAKLEFLTKLVHVVQTATGKTTTCKPAKTLAGQEPEGTCDLLCLLASCAKLSTADKEKAVKRALGVADPEPAAKKDDGTAEKAKEREKEREKEKEKEREKEKEKEKEKERDKEKERRERKERERAEREKEKDKEREKASTPTEMEEEDKEKDKRRDKRSSRDKDKKDATGGVAEVPKMGGGGAVERPSTATARKPPPPVRSNEVQEDRTEHPKEVAVVIREEKRGKNKEEDKEEKDWQKMVEEHAASRANTLAKAEEAQGYLGREAIEARKKQEELQKAEEAANIAAGRGGGLVIKSTINKDKAGSAVDYSELSRLREQLQMLTKATNPLGKFLEVIHQDIDTMSRELEMWRTEARTQAMAALEAQRQTEESLHGVMGNIQNVEDAISDQLNRTNILRATILSNDRTIDTLIRMVVSPDNGLSTKKK